MSEEQKPEMMLKQLENAQPQIVTTPGDAVFYTNTAGVQISPEEIVLQFGLINRDNPSQSPSLARVFMSPGHAKRLLFLLNATIVQYESVFGVVAANPEDLITPDGRKKLGMPEK